MASTDDIYGLVYQDHLDRYPYGWESHSPDGPLSGEGAWSPPKRGWHALELILTEVPAYYGREGDSPPAYLGVGWCQEQFAVGPYGLVIPIRNADQWLVSVSPRWSYGLHYFLAPGVEMSIVPWYGSS